MQKKRKLGDNLFTEEVETDEVVSKDTDTYLDKLRTLMIAYAMAGVHPVPGADPTKEVLGTSSAQFVTAPLDVLLAYFFRAKRCAAIIPPARRLQWLQARDTEERSEWVTKFREGTQSLGLVVKQISEARDAHWAVPAVAMSAPAGETGAGYQPSPPATYPPSSLFKPGPTVSGKKTASVMKDGTKLCPDFQTGKSKSAKCSKGAHRCAVVLRAQRVCGSPSHGASECRANTKA